MKHIVMRLGLAVLGLVLIGHGLIHLGIIPSGMPGPDGRTGWSGPSGLLDPYLGAPIIWVIGVILVASTILLFAVTWTGILPQPFVRRQRAMNRTIMRHDGLALAQQAEQTQPGSISEAQVLGLPEPLQRYLSYAQVVSKEPIRTVHLKQEGTMRTQPGQKWLPMVAEQYFTTKPPAFLWHATMRFLPFVWISATDQFSQGHGSMRIKLLSVIPMGNARGPEMDQGEMQRYLAEMIWFPTAWLTSAIEWQAIDAHSVKATLRASGVTAPVVLHVNEEGQLTHVTADRYKEEHGRYQLVPWSGQVDKYQEVEGVRIPTQIAITWHLATGDFTWFRCKLTEIEYNQSGKVKVL